MSIYHLMQYSYTMSTYEGWVLVLGATGGTGQQVVASLRRKGIPTRILVRDIGKTRPFEPLKVSTVVGSVLHEVHLEAACMGITAVINTLGTRNIRDLEEVEAVEHTVMANLVDIAQRRQIQHIITCTSMGTTYPEIIPFLTHVLRAKRRGEIVLEQSGLPFTIVRPGGLTDEAGGQKVLLKPEIGMSGSISRTDVAEVLVQALLQPAAQNRIVEIINHAQGVLADDPGLFLAGDSPQM